ncbi:MAG: phosphate/phosphite/phosphonate ABC transporter substrate-binding protein [Proteobacteria bacterium]|nr:phosphate/phosphite/phosphonate ABC transporter substrate-binding protein [Pseudomonadota bacterium]MBU1687992.1 phosphate/phosphite/phosphonate ABC transporter substrate-binding protein [Pseudomonadota bacterium]
MMKRSRLLPRFLRLSYLLAPLILCFLSISCDRQDPLPEIDLTQSGRTAILEPKPSGDEFQVAVGAMISPHETFIHYRELLDYLAEKAGKSYQLVLRKKYQEVNDAVRDGEVDLALVCSGAYVQGHDQFGMELLVAPMVAGKTVYYSYLIVNKNSTIRDLEDLRGKTFAFTDPMSNSGRLSPVALLAEHGETPESFFTKTIFTYSHDKSIKAVAHGLVDGAAVDSLIWDYFNATNDELTKETRIIHTSDPYGIPPLVVPPGLDPALKARFREIFLAMHTDPAGLKILQTIRIERFVSVDDSLYTSIRAMEALLPGLPAEEK